MVNKRFLGIKYKNPNTLLFSASTCPLILGVVVLERKRNSPTYRKYEFQGLGLTTPFGRFSVDGQVYVDTSYPQIGSDVVFSYGDTNTLQLKSYFDYLNNGDQDKQLTANLSFIPSQWPMYSFRSDLQVRKTPSAVSTSQIESYSSLTIRMRFT